MTIKLIGKEQVVPNDGNKRCRICGALILDRYLARTGCQNRHLTCYPPSKVKAPGKIAQLSIIRGKTGRVNHSRYQIEE